MDKVKVHFSPFIIIIIITITKLSIVMIINNTLNKNIMNGEKMNLYFIHISSNFLTFVKIIQMKTVYYCF